MKGITLHKGEPHINSGDAAAMHCGILGNKNYVLQAGEEFSYNKISNNLIRVYSGEGVLNGRHFRILPNEYTEFTIENGNQGVDRKDLLVVRYEKMADGTESIYPMVLKGTPALSNPSDPAYNKGNAYEGDTIADYPLYRVKLSGINIEAVDKLFEILPSLSNVWPVGSIYMSVNNTDPGILFGGTWIRFAQGRVLVGVQESDSSFSTPQRFGGEKNHKLAVAEIPSHAHGMNGHTHSHGSHTHTVGGQSTAHMHYISLQTASSGSEHTHDVGYDTAGNTFRTGDKNYRRVVNGSGFIEGKVPTCTDGRHTHITEGYSQGPSQDHIHSVTGGANGNTGGANGNTSNTGSGGEHNNLQPYVTCYMWRRMA